METLFISPGATLKRHENTVRIRFNKQTRSLPIEKLKHIVLLAESTLTSKLLSLCGQHGVRLSVFDYYGYFKGAFEPIDKNPAGKVKLQQAEFLLDTHRKLAVAQEVVKGAAHNMLANLRYYAYRGIKDLKQPIQMMQVQHRRISQMNTIPEIMGIEGFLHTTYFQAWKKIDVKLDLIKRVRRPPNNPINCLISFLNQMTYTVVRHEITKTHLEETFSFLHSPGYGRASLSLDLAEPFKPILADKLIFRLIKRNIVQKRHFTQQDNVCLLNESGRKIIAEQFSIRLEEKYQGRSFREWIYYEALAIERDVLGLAKYQSFKIKA